MKPGRYARKGNTMHTSRLLVDGPSEHVVGFNASVALVETLRLQISLPELLLGHLLTDRASITLEVAASAIALHTFVGTLS